MVHENSARRPGFTLTEMLLVLAIITLVAAMAVPAVIALNRGRAIRDASRQVQAVLIEMRSRAAKMQQTLGYRLQREADDPATSEDESELVRALVPVRLRGSFTSGTVHPLRYNPVNWPAMPPTPHTAGLVAEQADPQYPVRMVVAGPGVDWASFLNSGGGMLRLDKSGPWYSIEQFLPEPMTGPPPSSFRMLLKAGGLLPVLPQYAYDPSLMTPLYNQIRGRDGVAYEFLVYAEPLPGAQPVSLPEGIVLDLGSISLPPTVRPPAAARLSRVIPFYPPTTASPPPPYDPRKEYWDILFTPDGRVLFTQGELALLGLWLRKQESIMRRIPGMDPQYPNWKAVSVPGVAGDHAIVVVEANTGRVRTARPFMSEDSTYTDVSGERVFDPRLYYLPIERGQDGQGGL